MLVARIIDRELDQYLTSKFQKPFLHVDIHMCGDAVHVCLSRIKLPNLMTTNTLGYEYALISSNFQSSYILCANKAWVQYKVNHPWTLFHEDTLGVHHYYSAHLGVGYESF